jgi:hypothetical protein
MVGDILQQLKIFTVKQTLSTFILQSSKTLRTKGLYHPLDGITNPKFKLLHFLTTIFLQREEGTSISLG